MTIHGVIDHVDALGRMVVLSDEAGAIVIFSADQVRVKDRTFTPGDVVVLDREDGKRRMSDWRITG
jgi:hypothetical protein